MGTSHSRLLEASQTENVQRLEQMLRDDPQLLHNFSLTSGENPLYVASAAGRVDLVEKILESNQAFATEFNQDGFSPMDVASANGYLEIVRTMQREVPGVSQLKGKDEWTPLHYAARRGRVDIIREIVMACPGSVEDVTVQGETALHIGIKNSQFEAIRVLVELVREMNKLHVRNMKDRLGNSVLHLATWKKQHQVVEWLVGIGTAPGVLEVDSVNKSGRTALDLLLEFPSEAGDREIEVILRGAGALRARERVQSSSVVPSSGQNHNQMTSGTHQQQPSNVASPAEGIVHSSSDVPTPGQNHNQTAPHAPQEPVASTSIEIVPSSSPTVGQNQIQMAPLTTQQQPNNVPSTTVAVVLPVSEHINQNHTQTASQAHQEEIDYAYFKSRKNIDPESARAALLVVAVLVATASYDIALNPPGGLWSDTNLSTNGTEPPHLAGTSNIASYYPAYTIFGAVLNCIGFSVSLQMIYVLTTNFPLRLELIVCGIAMYITFINGLITIAPGETAGWYSLFALAPILPPVVLFMARWFGTPLVKLMIKLIITPLVKWMNKLMKPLLNRMRTLIKYIDMM